MRWFKRMLCFLICLAMLLPFSLSAAAADGETIVFMDGAGMAKAYSPARAYPALRDYPIKTVQGTTESFSDYEEAYVAVILGRTGCGKTHRGMETAYLSFLSGKSLHVVFLAVGHLGGLTEEDYAEQYPGSTVSNDFTRNGRLYSELEQALGLSGTTLPICVILNAERKVVFASSGESEVFVYGEPYQPWAYVHAFYNSLEERAEPYSFPRSGKCGEALSWALSDDGTLTVKGTGDMWEWYIDGAMPVLSVTVRPWSGLLSEIQRVVIGDGITEIGDYAFQWCTRMKSVVLPESVTAVGYRAFECCYGLRDVYYGGTAEAWRAVQIGYYNTDLTRATLHEQYQYPPKITSVSAPVLTERADSVTATLRVAVAGEEAFAYGALYEADGRFRGLEVVPLSSGESSVSFQVPRGKHLSVMLLYGRLCPLWETVSVDATAP